MITKRNTTILIILSLFLAPILSQTTDEVINGMVDRINDYYLEKPRDNVYIHTDRSVYFAGDVIFFRAAITDAANLRPSDRSETLTLMLVDAEGGEIMSATFEIREGYSEGSFRLPENMKQGGYNLVSYVLTGDQITTHKLYNKELLVVDPSGLFLMDFSLDQEKYKAGDKYNVTLSAYGSRSRPVSRVDVEYDLFNDGEIIYSGKDKTGKEGQVVLTGTVPQDTEENLFIKVTADKRRTKQTMKILIPVKKDDDQAGEGKMKYDIQLNASQVSDRKVQLNTTYSKTTYTGDEQVIVTVFRKGLMYWSAPGRLSQTESLGIPATNIPSGILHLVLLNNEGTILTQEMVYFERTDQPNISVNTEGESFARRREVVVEIQAKPAVGDLISGTHLSVSVVPEELVAAPNLDIKEYMLIDADIVQDTRMDLLSITDSGNSSELLNEKLVEWDRNGYRMDRILGKEIQTGSEEDELFSGGFQGRQFFPGYFDAEKMKDFGTNIKDKRHPDAEELTYKRLLENGMAVKEVIKTIKPYSMDGNKIIFAGTTNSINNQQGALIVIDNQQMGEDASVLGSIPPTDVESIFVSTDPSDIQKYTGLNVVGVIEIRMKGYGQQARLSEETPRDELVRESNGKYLPGYPDYSIENDSESVLSDFRKLLYWNSDLRLDEKGSASFNFYTPDLIGTYVIKVEGMMGIFPVSVTRKIEVK